MEEKEEYWSKFAGTFDGDVEYIVGPEINDAIRDKLGQLDNLGIAVEFGCGTGIFTSALAGNADSVVATDLSDEMLEKARHRLADYGNVMVRKASCYNSGFDAGEFDTALIANTLHMLEMPEDALREISRVLKPGGRLIVFSYTGRHMPRDEKEELANRFFEKWGKPPYAKNFSLETLGEFVSGAGFEVKESVVLGEGVKAVFLVAEKG